MIAKARHCARLPPEEGRMTAQELTLKEMCARFDVTPRTLRHYEYIELLTPRRAGRARYYGAREMARMKLILRGRRFGFSLEEIRQWLLLYDEDRSTRRQMEVWIAAAGQQIAELQSRRLQLDEAIRELEDLREIARRELDGRG